MHVARPREGRSGKQAASRYNIHFGPVEPLRQKITPTHSCRLCALNPRLQTLNPKT